MASGKELLEMVQTYASLHSVRTDLQTLSLQEKKLFELVKEGDIEGVQKHLDEESVDINVVDHKGQFPLQLAVRNQDEEMVQLLQAFPNVEIKDALLHAIKLGNVHITETLLTWKEQQEASGKTENSFESADFPNHMEPMTLACIHNKYEIILLMLQKSYRLEIPVEKSEYNKRGRNSEKMKVISGESLEAGRARIDGFTALSSSVYICLTSPDPILTAFYLAHKADKLAVEDANFRHEYLDISTKCKHFAVALLDECRTSEEVELLLKQDHDNKTSVIPGGKYPRLRMAIEWEIKEFITHKNCQQVMQNMWTQNHPDIMRMTFFAKCAYFLPQMLVLPLVYIAYYLYPCANIYSYWKAPMNKFLGDMTMYIFFLVLLFYDVFTQSASGVYKRFPDFSVSDILIIIFVFGYIWEQVRATGKQGLRSYIKDWWLAYTALMTICFVASGIARVVSIIITLTEDSDYQRENRIFWPSEDPALIAEGFFCIALILAYARILYMFQISQVLGPIQISLSQMIYDVLQMLFIFLVFMLAFAMGLTRLYYFYEGMIRIENGAEQIQPSNFVSFQETFKTLFWDIFGYGDPEHADVVVNNTCLIPAPERCLNTSEHKFTEAVGFSIYGVYHLVVIVILLNMLIALMSNTFFRIQANGDTEWKFARSRLWLTYFERRRLLPIPLSAIPSPYSIYRFIQWVKERYSAGKSGRAEFNLAECWYFTPQDELEMRREAKNKYGPLQRRLVARYLSQLEDEVETEILTSEDLEQTKQDLIKEMVRMTSGAGRKFSRLQSVRRSGSSPQPNATNI